MAGLIVKVVVRAVLDRLSRPVRRFTGREWLAACATLTKTEMHPKQRAVETLDGSRYTRWMRMLAADTPPQAGRVLIVLLRSASPACKFGTTVSFNRTDDMEGTIR
jgi:hypothetical protein